MPVREGGQSVCEGIQMGNTHQSVREGSRCMRAIKWEIDPYKCQDKQHSLSRIILTRSLRAVGEEGQSVYKANKMGISVFGIHMMH